MLIQLVDAVLGSVAGSSITFLEYRAYGHRIRLERVQADASPGSDEIPCVPPVIEPPENRTSPDGQVTIVRAAMFGTFYRAASPDQAPLAEVGQTVEAGQQLGLLEAMKTLHAIEAECAGQIQEILVESGVAVEAGTALLTIRGGQNGSL